MTKKTESDTGIASALKEQLALITFVILFAGIVSTETYYAGFSIRYQVMEFDITHLVYRGLTSVVDGPFLIGAYLVAMAWLAGGSAWVTAKGAKWAPWIQPITYLLIILVVVVAYFAAIAAGAHAAGLDLAAQTSRLPVVREIKGKDGTILPFADYRLLIVGKDTVIVFKPAATAAESPFIHLLKRDDAGDITLTR